MLSRDFYITLSESILQICASKVASRAFCAYDELYAYRVKEQLQHGHVFNYNLKFFQRSSIAQRKVLAPVFL